MASDTYKRIKLYAREALLIDLSPSYHKLSDIWGPSRLGTTYLQAKLSYISALLELLGHSLLYFCVKRKAMQFQFVFPQQLLTFCQTEFRPWHKLNSYWLRTSSSISFVFLVMNIFTRHDHLLIKFWESSTCLGFIWNFLQTFEFCLQFHAIW